MVEVLQKQPGKWFANKRKKGGLGVINLEMQNQALLMKNLDKFFNKKDIPWVHLVWEKHYTNGRLPSAVKKGSFWWRDTLKLLQKFKEMALIQVKDGQSCLFWKDKWLIKILEQQFPQLYSFAKNKAITVSRALNLATFTGGLYTASESATIII